MEGIDNLIEQIKTFDRDKLARLIVLELLLMHHKLSRIEKELKINEQELPKEKKRNL